MIFSIHTYCQPLERILIIGSGGSGKTTLAQDLAALTGLPLIHLDQEYWSANWTPTPKPDWHRMVDALIATPRWIMDGNYGGTLERRLQRADTVVWLDLPRVLCLWRVLRRSRYYHGRPRPEMPDGCDERLSLDFLRWIWLYPHRQRPRLQRLLQSLPPTTRVHVLRSRREVRDFLKMPPSRQLARSPAGPQLRGC